MLIENDAHPDKPQQDEPHQQAGHHAGKIDPDIGDLAAAARHKELDGLIGQGCEQAAQHGPGHMLEEVPGVHPQAEHEQEAFQQILTEMRQLAHDVHGEPVGGTGKAQMPQDALQYPQYPAAGPLGHIRDLQRVGEDEHDAADEGKSKDHPPRDEPRGGALILFLHPLSPEP